MNTGKVNMNQIIKQSLTKNNYIKQNEILQIKKKLSIPYPMKEKYNMIIPPNIFQTWHTKLLPPLMYNATKKLRNTNPNFRYYLYDDNDCHEFIKKNFEKEILDAYNKLIPGAFKADLWRLCILYKYGGIYVDIKYIPVNGFKFINLTEKEHWVMDIDNNNIYNALIVSLPGNQNILKAIHKIVENVQNNYYGNNFLDVTGPGMLSNFFTRQEKDNFDMRHDVFLSSVRNRVIYLNKYIVLKSYNGYLEESKKFQKVDYYATLWNQRRIYN
jgi:mannosyltransferase OCH1-like enzyme